MADVFEDSDEAWVAISTGTVEDNITANTSASIETDTALAAGVPVTGDEETVDSCIICLDAPVTHSLVPCGHAHFCADCSAMIVAGAVQDPPLCPMCRQPVTGSAEVEMQIIVEQQPEREQARDAVASFAFLLRTGSGSSGTNNSSSSSSMTPNPG